MDWYTASANEVLAEVKEQYPDQIGKLDIRTMRKLLSGHYNIKVDRPKKAKSIKQSREEKKHAEWVLYCQMIAKAENYVGDIMYEMAGGNLHKVEMMSKKDLDYCRYEAMITAYGGSIDPDVMRKAVKYWNKRGF